MDPFFWRKATTIFIVAVVGVSIVFDVYLAWFNKEKDDTISFVLRNWGHANVVVPWLWAILAGHLFWTRPEPLFDMHTSIVVLVVITLIIAAVGYYVQEQPWMIYFALIAGVYVGHMLWPQAPV